MLTWGEYYVLGAILTGCSTSECIAKRAGLKRKSVNRILKRLEKKGYVRRKRKSGKWTIWEFTEKGWRLSWLHSRKDSRVRKFWLS